MLEKSGIKWISNLPENRASNLARASAVLILNDSTTGYPLACIEASLISATRTAASAALAAEHISPHLCEGALGVIGTGIIARTTVDGGRVACINSFHFSTQLQRRAPSAKLFDLQAGRLVMGTSLGDKVAIVIALLLLAVGGVMIFEFPGIIRAARLVATM